MNAIRAKVIRVIPSRAVFVVVGYHTSIDSSLNISQGSSAAWNIIDTLYFQPMSLNKLDAAKDKQRHDTTVT